MLCDLEVDVACDLIKCVDRWEQCRSSFRRERDKDGSEGRLGEDTSTQNDSLHSAMFLIRHAEITRLLFLNHALQQENNPIPRVGIVATGGTSGPQMSVCQLSIDGLSEA